MPDRNTKYNIQDTKYQAGFTLVELLIVMGIVSVLSAVVVLTLHPTDFFRQARDSTRFSNISTINKALVITLLDSLPLGTANTVYVSIPDTFTNCGNLDLPILPSGWNYACVTAENLRNVNGTGWIPVNLTAASLGSPLSVLPIDPTNSASLNLYYTYTTTSNSTYTIKAQALESARYIASNPNGFSLGNGSALAMTPYTFPTNWVAVPGNGTFGTSDFYVMEYEAKCVQTSNNTPLTSPDTGYHTYSNSGQSCSGSNYYVASTPDGYPIANISHNTALSYCTTLGGHLLTNDEWMTIATNAANIASNWKNGVVGSAESAGGLYRGNTNSSLAMDGTNPLSGTNTRTWTLSNGSVIWDIAGNVWEHVKRSTNNVGDLTTTITTPTCSSGSTWCEYAGSGAHITAWNDASFSAATVGPPNGSWYSAQGIGQVYPATGGTSGTVFLRGGSWSIGTNAGAFTLYLYWGTGAAGYYVGFRCAR